MTTPATSLRIERALDTAAQSRIEGVAALPGNPLQVEARRFGPITATVVRSPTLYYGYYNTLRGVHEGTIADLEAAAAWLRSEGASLRITTSPLLETELLQRCLEGLGLQAIAKMSLRHASPIPQAASGIEVLELAPESRSSFVGLWLAANPSDTADAVLRGLCAAEFADWRVFVATLSGRPSAYGCLYVENRVAVLASAWTAPEARGNGLQTALLRRRIAEASAAGCDLVVSTAAPGSGSERNLSRVGLNDGYMQSIWT